MAPRPSILRRLLQTILAAVVLLLLLAVLGAGGLWWWAGTPGSLQWALAKVEQTQGVKAQGARGTLRTGLDVDRLSWEKDGLKLEADQVALAWQPLALLNRTLRLDHLRAAALRVTDGRAPTGKPLEPPTTLGVPFKVSVGELAIGRIEWLPAAQDWTASGLAGRYAFDGARHRIVIDRLALAGGVYQGQATLEAGGALALAARFQGQVEAPLPGGGARLPVRFTATLDGPLAQLEGRLLLDAGARPGGTEAGGATVTARITPWLEQPLPQAHAQLRALNLHALWPQAPRTLLDGALTLRPAGAGSWTLSADLRNGAAGPWDRGQLPAQALRAEGEWRTSGQALVRSLQAQAGGGRVEASGQWRGPQGWTVDASLHDVDPGALHTAMAALPVGGTAVLRGEGERVEFDLRLTAQNAPPPARGAPARAAQPLRALELREAQARGHWLRGLLVVPALQVRTADASLQGNIELRPATWAGAGRLALEAPALQASAEGSLSQSAGRGTLRLASSDLGKAQAWLARLPEAPVVLREQLASGRGELQASWQGGWQDPALQGQALLPLLALQPAGGAAGADAPAAGWSLRDARLSLDGRLSDARVQARGTVLQGERRIALDLAGRGGRRAGNPPGWQGQLSAFTAAVSDPALGTGAWTLAMRNAVDLRWSSGRFDAGAGEALLIAPPRPLAGRPPSSSQAVLNWDPLQWGGGELRTAGRISGLPLEWMELLGGAQLAGAGLAGDMVFSAQWDARLGRAVQLRASLERSAGDISVRAENAEGGSTRVPAGVRQARLSLASEGEALTLTARWDSERAGTVDGQLRTRLAQGGATGWHWPESAPLSGALKAQLPRIGVWSLLAPPGWRLRGSLLADLSIAGTRADPQLAGRLEADDLALRSVVDGIELQGGRLRARLEGQRLRIDEFLLRGGGPAGQGGGGTLTASGEGSWVRGGPQLRMEVKIAQLRASVRSDRELTLSGQASASVDAQAVLVSGSLRIDRARIVVPEETPPRLGDDVVVRTTPGAPPVKIEVAKAAAAAAAAPAGGKRKFELAMDLDLGNDFRVSGRGIDSRLRGTLQLSGQAINAPRLHGTVLATGGEYRAYGQRLTLERGELRFTGPVDNPALNILAVRPNMLQKVGVEVTGRAQSPFVRLYAEPDLPDAEKLSWLVLGRASASGGAEAALLQQAAVALLASRGGGGSRGPAAALGLDELSFSRTGADGPSITLGKRFAQNFYAAYERSLSGALGTLFVFYEVSRRVTVRAQAGERAAVDLIFTLSFD